MIGGGDPGDGLGDGEFATAAKLREPAGLAVGRGGELIVADAGSGRVRMVDGAGTIRTIAGGGGEAYAEKAPAAAVDLDGPTGVTISPDQALVVSEPGADRVSHVQELMPGFSDGDLLIPSEDGSLVFQFDAEGRHERTLDALTGAVVRRFAYDAEGRLTSIYDDAAGAAQPHSPVLTVSRPDADTVVLHTRGGRETELAIDANGWLDSATNPAGEVHDLTHDAEGLLTGEEDAEGGTHSFEYDALGRLVKDTDPDGAFKTLAVAEIADGRQVTMESSGGQTTIYRDTLDAEGNRVHSVTAPSGATATTTRRPDGTLETVREDGTRFEQRLAPDPRFGMQAPYTALTRTTTPGGRSRTVTATRSVAMRDATKVESAVATNTIDGKTSTRTYEARPGDDGGTILIASPEGRESMTELDDHGRITSSRAADGIQEASTVYEDANDGRIATQSLGGRSWTYEYDARDRITKRTDAEGNETTYTYDAADRLLTTTRDGKTYTAGYDDTGRRTSIETPGGATSTFTYTPAGLADTLALPGTEPYERSFNDDGQLTGETLPSGDTLGQTFDSGHRLGASAETRDGAGSPLLERSWEYLGSTSRVARLTRSAGAINQHLDRAYDGQLPTEVAFAGDAAGTFSFATSGSALEYDEVEVDAGSGAPRTYAISRDDDQLVTGLGPFEIERDAATARAKSFVDAADETVVETLDTEGYGELDERHLSAGGAEAYTLTVERDEAGRVVRREEEISGGGAIVRVYVYDGLSRLIRVEDGSGGTVEEYTYDDDGNRTSATAPGHGAQAATYDGATGLQTAAGPLSLSFDEDGFLAERGGEEFTYAPSGELLQAEAGGTTVTYDYDGLGRMVRRTAGGDETTYLYGNPDNALEVTATTDETGELTTYFYDDFGNLHAIERGTTRYRIGTDQVGTPRVVVDSGGNVVKQVDRDTYGRVLADSEPGFELPIGYAGGIEDPDTGLVRFGARDYDPETGRFTARDPALYRGSPSNLFAYAESAPSDRRDPTGLETWAASLYYGIGGGLSFSRGADGSWSVCGEYGFGLAGGAEFDPLGQPENGQSLVREVSSSIKAGPILKVDGSFSIENPLPSAGNPCPEAITQDQLTDRSKVLAKGGISAASYGVVATVDGDGNFGAQGTRSLDLAAGFEGGAKGAYKDCIKMKGSLW